MSIFLLAPSTVNSGREGVSLILAQRVRAAWLEVQAELKGGNADDADEPITLELLPPGDWIGTKDVCKVLGRSPKSLERYCREARLRRSHVPAPGRRPKPLWNRKDVEQLWRELNRATEGRDATRRPTRKDETRGPDRADR